MFPAIDSPAYAGSHDGESKEGHAAQAGLDDADVESRDVAGKASSGKECLWPATFLLNNIRGLLGMRGENKVPLLYDLAALKNSLWIAVTETWLHSGVLDSELLVHIPGYSILRQDRMGRQRGGVCLFLRDDLTGEVLCGQSNGVCELLMVKVHQLDTIITVIYRPPDTYLREFSPILNKVESVLQNLPAPTPNITIMGDLNFPHTAITWSVIDGVIVPRVAGHRQASVGSDSIQVRQQAAQLCELATRYHLSQQVSVPTRESEILDLIWSSNPDLVSNINVDP